MVGSKISVGELVGLGERIRGMFALAASASSHNANLLV
jgi:hypothetical protein